MSGKTDDESMTDTSFPISTTTWRAVIEIGAKEFMCVGAKPPFDHPACVLRYGRRHDYVCPYCSTLYRHDPELAPKAARPAECALTNVPL